MSDVIYEYTVKVRTADSLSERDREMLEEHVQTFLAAGSGGEACVMPSPIELDADLYELRHLLPVET